MTQEEARREAKRYIEMLRTNGFAHWNGERFVWVYLAINEK
jgi:hypothetical protein